MSRVAVIDVLGHTLQVIERDDTLTVQEILPAPFILHEDLPDVRARDLAANRARYQRQKQQPVATPKPAYRPVPKDAAERMRQSGEAGR